MQVCSEKKESLQGHEREKCCGSCSYCNSRCAKKEEIEYGPLLKMTDRQFYSKERKTWMDSAYYYYYVIGLFRLILSYNTRVKKLCVNDCHDPTDLPATRSSGTGHVYRDSVITTWWHK